MDQEAFFSSPVAGLYTLRDLAVIAGVSVEEMARRVEKRRVPPRRRHGVVRLWDETARAILCAEKARR